MSIIASKTCAAKSAAKLEPFFEIHNRFPSFFYFSLKSPPNPDPTRRRQGAKPLWIARQGSREIIKTFYIILGYSGDFLSAHEREHGCYQLGRFSLMPKRSNAIKRPVPMMRRPRCFHLKNVIKRTVPLITNGRDVGPRLGVAGSQSICRRWRPPHGEALQATLIISC